MDEWDKAIDMRGHGATWAEINRATGITVDKLQWRLDPAHRQKRLQRKSRNTGYQAGDRSQLRIERTVKPWEAERAIASIPRDTRKLTARIFGDPLPGRSALDRRGQ